MESRKVLKCKFHQAVQVKNTVVNTVEYVKHKVDLTYNELGLTMDWEGAETAVLIPSYNCFEVHFAKEPSSKSKAK